MVMNNSLEPPFGDFRCLKQTFLSYLRDFSVVENDQELLLQLGSCPDSLPDEAAQELGLPPGSTYAEAVDLLTCRWKPT